MRFWTFFIDDEKHRGLRCGYVWAETAQAALTEVNHPETSVYSLPDNVEVFARDLINPREVPQDLLRQPDASW